MKKLLAISWFMVLISLFILQYHFKGESVTFMGIMDNSGQTISFEYPVEIDELNVIEGQRVKQAASLLKVHRSSLSAEQAILNKKIHELTHVIKHQQLQRNQK